VTILNLDATVQSLFTEHNNNHRQLNV